MPARAAVRGRRTLREQLDAGEEIRVPGQLAAFALDDVAPEDTVRQLGIFDPELFDAEDVD